MPAAPVPNALTVLCAMLKLASEDGDASGPAKITLRAAMPNFAATATLVTTLSLWAKPRVMHVLVLVPTAVRARMNFSRRLVTATRILEAKNTAPTRLAVKATANTLEPQRARAVPSAPTNQFVKTHSIVMAARALTFERGATTGRTVRKISTRARRPPLLPL